MPFEQWGEPPSASECEDTGRLGIARKVPPDGPEHLVGRQLPDKALIREAVFILQKKPGSYNRGHVQLSDGEAEVLVGPRGWAVKRKTDRED